MRSFFFAGVSEVECSFNYNAQNLELKQRVGAVLFPLLSYMRKEIYVVHE